MNPDDDPDGALRVDTSCSGCGGSGSIPVTENDGDRTWESATVCLRCGGSGEDPNWRERAGRLPPDRMFCAHCKAGPLFSWEKFSYAGTTVCRKCWKTDNEVDGANC